MAKPGKIETLDQVVAYCLTKPGAWLDDPWGGGHQVAKVADKMFMMAGAHDDAAFAVRCIDMQDRDTWRQTYPGAVIAQPYMVHIAWNRILLDKGVLEEDLRDMLDVSYDTVVSKLPKKSRPEGWVALQLE